MATINLNTLAANPTKTISLGGVIPKSPGLITLISPLQGVRALTSTKTTAGLAGILATLTGGPVAGIKTFLGVGLGLGILEASPLVRQKVGERVLDPTGAGKFVGGKIEEIAAGGLPTDTSSLKDKIIGGAKTAGLVGAGAAAAAGLLSLAKRSKDLKIPSFTPGKTSLQANPLVAAPIAPSAQPFGAAQRAKSPETASITPNMPIINNKISVKPEINISFKKSLKFINQQILIKR